jgi:galactose mutarotase-like enzyme
MKLHGFARGSELTVDEQTETSIVFTLTDSASTRSCYPFKFLYSITYQLDDAKGLKITYSAKNCGSNDMPFTFGGHPGFNIEGDFAKAKLTFGADVKPVRIGFNENCHLNGKDVDYPLDNGVLNLRHNLFDDDAVVLRDSGGKVRLTDESGAGLDFYYADFKYLGIWHANKTDAPFVCLEPWCALPGRAGVTEDLTKMSDYFTLPPEGELSKSHIIEIL